MRRYTLILSISDVPQGKLLLAGAIQGAIFRAVKEATDHPARRAFYRTTGYLARREAPRPRIKNPAQTGLQLGRKNWRIAALQLGKGSRLNLYFGFGRFAKWEGEGAGTCARGVGV